MRRTPALLLVTIAATALGACSLLSGSHPPKTIPAHTWEPYNEGLGVDIVGLAVHPTDLDRLVIQTAAGIYYTTTGGTTPWTLAMNAPVAAQSPWANLVPNVISPDPKDPNRLYTVALKGAYRSTDFGMSWSDITGTYPDWLRTWVDKANINNCGFFIAAIRPHPTIPGTLIAGTIVSGGEGGVLRSTTDGATWDRIAFTCDVLCPSAAASTRRGLSRRATEHSPDGSLRPPRTCPQIGKVLDNDVWPIVIHPTTPSIMIAGGPYANEAGRSVDGGQTWSPLPPPVAGAKIRTIAVNPLASENWIISGTRTFRSSNSGVAWTHTPSDPGLVEVQYDEYGNIWGHDGGSVWHLPHGGNQWERIPFGGEAGITGVVVRWAAGVHVLFAATAGDGLWVKRGPDSWSRVPLDGVGTALRVRMVKPTRAGDGHLLMPESGRIRIRLQNDRSWRPLTPIPIGPQDFAVAASVTEVCYGGAVELACWKPGEASWTPLPHGVAATRGFFSVRYDAISDDRLFATAGLANQENVLLRFSRGAGGFVLDWMLPLPKGDVAYRLTVHPLAPGRLYLALFDRVIRVDGIDGATPTWSNLGAFVPVPPNRLWLSDIQVNPADPDELYVVDPDGQRLFHKSGTTSWQELTPLSLSQGGTTATFGIGELALDWSGGRTMAVSGWSGELQEQQPDGTWAVGTLKVRDAAGSAWRAVSYSGVPPETESRALLFLPWAPGAALLATYDLGIYVRDVRRERQHTEHGR